MKYIVYWLVSAAEKTEEEQEGLSESRNSLF